jgi:hypothetical protein
VATIRQISRNGPNADRLYGCGARLLHAWNRGADTTGMTAFELDELESVPAWRSVLAAYRDGSVVARAKSAEFDGWLPRLAAVDGLDSVGLSTVHGRLIALGFLKFQVGGRTVGLQYQLAAEGRHALESDVLDEDAADSAVDDETQESLEPLTAFTGPHPGRASSDLLMRT